MLWTLTFIAVRQHQGDAVDAAPLDFARGDELVNHDLRTIGKIAELCFPDHHGTWIVGCVAIFKGQHGFFGQDRVDHDKRCLVVSHVLQRHIGARIPLLAALVMNHRMAVRERSTSAVFSGQTHWIAAGNEGSKRHVLAHSPVHRHIATTHGSAVVIDFLDEIVWRYGCRNSGDLFGQTFPLGHRNSGVTSVRPLLADVRAPVNGVLALEVCQDWIKRALAGVQCGARGFDHVVTQRFTHALSGQLVGVEAARTGMLCNFFVHQRLGQRRCVLLVVAQFAKTDDIDNNILLKFHAELKRQLRGQYHGFRVIAVDVKDRRFNHLDDVGAIQRGTTVARIAGGKADLVVNDEVNGAAREIAPGFGQCQCFHHHALTGECRVAMHQHRQYLQTFRVGTAVHASTHRAFNDRVHNLQMGRIERQRQVNRTACGRHIRAETLVVFHVTAGQVFRRCMVKLCKQIGGHFAQRIDQHIQATPVRHANHDFLHTDFAAALDQLVHAGNEAFAAFKREALLSHVLGMQKALKAFSSRQAV